MKKQIYLLIIAISIILISCDEWLYVEPTDGITVDEYWQSKEDVENAVFGCYASLLDKTDYKGYQIPVMLLVHGEMRADMTTYFNSRQEFLYLQDGDILPDNVMSKWECFYKTINNCNLIIYYASIVQDRDPTFTTTERLELEAEARAMRALMYFYLVRIWDEVPLKITAQIDDNVEFLIPQSSRIEIFNQIKKDLETAEKHIPLTYIGKEGYTPDWDKGRLTRYTVNAIQADVHLWLEEYDEAITACDKIINSGKFGLIDGALNPEQWFIDVFVNGNSSESIFELQFHPEKTNPFYNMLSQDLNLIVNYARVDDVFLNDPDLPSDSIDIRSEGVTYRASRQYMFWKYMGKTQREQRSSSESYAHFFIYRYAEILLFKAEALIYSETQRDLNEALSIINNLRRKRHASKLSAFEGSLTSPDVLGPYLLEERNREFMTEGKRWFDVLRFGKKDNYKNKNIIIGNLIASASSDRLQSLAAKANDTCFYYMPIHIDEIRRNSKLVQNRFYK